MALRDKLRDRSQPFLEPGEVVEQVFPAQAGNPWMVGLGGGILMMLLGKPRDVVVTDRAVVVFRQSKATATPKEILGRLPRATQIGPLDGSIWAKTELNGEKLWVHRRFHRDVKSADAALASAGDGAASAGGEATTST
jgi:hypothetical protein